MTSRTGCERLKSMVLSRPSWPKLLLPQQKSLPAEPITHVCESPAAKLVIAAPPPTPLGPEPQLVGSTGVGESVLLPLPSWPDRLSPQQRRPLSTRDAQLWP